MKNLIKQEDMNMKKIIMVGAGALAAMAATIFLIRKYKKEDGVKPPRKAPQLSIENPGSQDDFPKPPIESELG